MIKRLCLLLVGVLFGAVAYAQPVLPNGVSAAFFTSFENPSALDCVVVSGTPGWEIDASLRFPNVPGRQAVRGRVTALDRTALLTTKPFSTLGQQKVWLDFAHIAKVEQGDSAVIQVSINGGTSWITLGGGACSYLGSGLNFAANSSFSPEKYPGDWQLPLGGITPTNSWWKNERFDISAIASNQADVRVRFRYFDANNNGGGTGLISLTSPVTAPFYGWVVDSILVTTAFSEVIRPVINHTPIRGLQFDIAQTLSATVADSAGCDSTGVLDAWAFYRVSGSSVFDSIQLNRVGTTNTWSRLLDTSVIRDGDTVRYFLRARDSSPRQNVRYFPASANPGDTVITFLASFNPTMTHTPLVGRQFSAGPFPIAANVSDASGIDSAILHYRVNSGPWQLRKMTFISGILYRDSITVLDGDTVDYYLEAVDNSARRFRRQLPDTAAFWSFISSGDPIVEWPSTSAQCDVYLGAIFSLGPFQIGVRATDGSGIDTVMMYYKVNSGAWDSVGAVRNTVANAFCTWIATIPGTLDSDTISYYVKVIDGSSRRNFTISPSASNPRQFVSLGGIRFPYVDNFDASDVWRGYVAAGSLTNPTLTPGGWVRGVPAKSNLNAARSAPNAWMPGPLNANYPNNVWYILESPVFDFSTAQNANLSFWHRRDVNNGGAATTPGTNGNGDGYWIEYTENVNATNPVWLKLGNGNAADTNQVNWYNRSNINGLTGATGGAWDGTTGWERSLRRLVEPAFQGNGTPKSIKFRFVFRSNTSLQANGVLIDDFSIVIPPQRDLTLTTIASNPQNLAIGQANNNFQILAGDSLRLFIRLRNLGVQIIDTVVPIVVEIGSTYRDTTFINTGRILPNAFSAQALQLKTIPNAPARQFTVRVYSVWPFEQNTENDTISVDMFGVPQFPVPASDNFDGAQNNWLPLSLTPGGPVIWERGVPAGTQLNAAASAPNVWGTNLAGTVGTGSVGVLLSPLYSFNNAVNTTIRFKMNRRLPSGAGVRVSFADSLNTNWLPLGTATPGWYNNPSPVVVANVAGPAFINSSSNFETHSLEMPPAFNYRQTRGVRFRFEFQNASSFSTEGVIIDDFEILPPPPREVGIVGIFRPVACPDSLKANDTIQVMIRNFGGDTLRQIPFNFNFNNGPDVLATDFVFNTVLAPAEQVLVTLPAFTSPLPAGNYTLRVYTKLSSDARTSNDTISRCVKAIPQVDLLITQTITPPTAICYPSGPREVKFVVRNIGHTATTAFTAGYILDSLPPVTQSFNRVIAPNAYDTIALTVPVNIPIGSSLVRMFVNATADPVRPNDTARVSIFGRDPLLITHINRFEGAGALPYCDLIPSNGVARIVDNVPNSNNPGGKVLFMGSIGGIFSTTAPAGNNFWADNWNASWFTRIAIPVETVGRDSIRIRFDLLQIAGTTSTNPSEATWTFFRIVANGRQIGQTFRPTGPSPSNPSYQRNIDFRLDTVYTPGEPLIIELQSKTRYPFVVNGNRNANLVDNLIIYNSMPHGAEVLDVSYSPPFPSSTTPVTVTARIRNTGNLVMNTVQANLNVNGTIVQTVNAPLNLPFMADTAYTFSTTFNPLLGNNDLCVYTANPNGQNDFYPLDDTLCINAVGFPVISSFPYCNDFDSNLPAWLTRNPVTLRDGGNNFQFGTPNKGFINGAASGVNAWYVGSDSLYGAYDSSAVYTPIFEVRQGECYQISFKSKYLTDFWNNNPNGEPLWGDGATLEYSTDGGANFTNFGRLDTVGNEWYVGVIQALRQFNSTPSSLGYGWGAKSDSSWMTMRQIFNTTTNNLVLFRFRFGSDDAFQGEGFAFDDFCFEVVPGPCGLVSVEEESLNGFVLKQNYPNPFDVSTTIDYVLPGVGQVKVSVRDLLGRQVHALNQGMQNEGPHSVTLDLKNLEAGVYFYTVNFNGIEQTRKMIINK